MILELAAGRLFARQVGASVYTWTAVIGVVLAGITIGNYFGGRLADAFAAQKTLPVLLALSAAACVTVVILDNPTADTLELWDLTLPAKVSLHVALLFFIPSMLLGTITPVVAKRALDARLAKGRTVGDIYAWAAAGSIAGTFLAGFWLIAAVGTVKTIWAVAAALTLLTVLYGPKQIVTCGWAAVFLVLLGLALLPCRWAESTALVLKLREEPDPKILYETESQYSYIAVKQASQDPDERQFMQDNIENHSRIVMGNIRDLRLFYSHIYAGITELLAADRERLSVLAIGGGGYVFPRYVLDVWPQSRVDVAEIDPGVTEAAIKAFGLEQDSPINTFNMDARHYVDQLLRRKKQGEKIPQYDFVYGDAFNDVAVPYQLVTKEFSDKISAILTEDGAYLVNLIDSYDNGRFLPSFVKTIQQTFPFVYVFTKKVPPGSISNFVVVASKQPTAVKQIDTRYLNPDVDLWLLDADAVVALQERPTAVTLTDDYAPVEHLLASTALERANESAASRYLRQANTLARQNRWDLSTPTYEKAMQVFPGITAAAYNQMGQALAEQGQMTEAAAAFRKALDYNQQSAGKTNVTAVCYNMASVLKQLGRDADAAGYFLAAMAGLRENFKRRPDNVDVVLRLAKALAETGQLDEAITHYRRVIELEPSRAESHFALPHLLATQGHYDQAFSRLEASINFMQQHGRDNITRRLIRLREELKASMPDAKEK